MEGAAYLKPEAILKKLKLVMPITLTLEDPITRQPITISYENMHQMLLVDLTALPLEDQIVSALYAEMGRFQRASEYAVGRAEIRYRKWKAVRSEELKTDRKNKKEKAPTKEAVEAYYRDHEEYEHISGECDRLKAIAGLFDDLKWSFKMKSTHMQSASRMILGYEQMQGASERMAASGSAERASDRLNDYISLAEQAIALTVGAVSGTEPKRTARPLGE